MEIKALFEIFTLTPIILLTIKELFLGLKHSYFYWGYGLPLSLPPPLPTVQTPGWSGSRFVKRPGVWKTLRTSPQSTPNFRYASPSPTRQARINAVVVIHNREWWFITCLKGQCQTIFYLYFVLKLCVPVVVVYVDLQLFIYVWRFS